MKSFLHDIAIYAAFVAPHPYLLPILIWRKFKVILSVHWFRRYFTTINVCVIIHYIVLTHIQDLWHVPLELVVISPCLCGTWCTCSFIYFYAFHLYYVFLKKRLIKYRNNNGIYILYRSSSMSCIHTLWASHFSLNYIIT